MKFFFPDSQDQIDPRFDFINEKHPKDRIRQRDDLYAHEALGFSAYSGVLLSKAIVDGEQGGQYSLAQRHRLRRQGIRKFFRLNDKMDSIGDCGAFAYVKEEKPPFSVDEVISFYKRSGVSIGVSVDHIILGYNSDETASVPDEWVNRQRITLDLAQEFWDRHRELKCDFVPMGVAQGWSPASYRSSVQVLQEIGFDYIGIGGLVPLKSTGILECLKAIQDVRLPSTRLHLFGVTRCEYINEFAECGVVSFDSTSPFLQAFKDSRNNDYAPSTTYMAIRVPQVDGNPKLKRLVSSGKVDQQRAQQLERESLRPLRSYDKGEESLEAVMSILIEYERLYNTGKSRADGYRRTLKAKPWKDCPCPICTDVGVEVILLRGTERNKRRGFHNVFAFNRYRLKDTVAENQG